jgi:hypothetical protein
MQPADGSNTAAAAACHRNTAYRKTMYFNCLLRLLLHARTRHFIRHDRGKFKGMRGGGAGSGRG